jgi:transposase
VPWAPAPGLASRRRSLHASERHTPRVQHARQDDRQKIAALDFRRLRFVDESGVNLAMTRLHGRAPAGERVVGSAPQNYGPDVTMPGALSVHGLQALVTVGGATDAEAFRTHGQQALGPALRPGDVVVTDNLQAHKAVGGQQALARRGARLLYLPPYSPDLSPIEPCRSKVKTALRKAKARTRRALGAARAGVMVTVSLADAWGWPKQCGYPLQ